MASVALRRLNSTDLESLATLDAACFAAPWQKPQLGDELAHKDALVIGAFEVGELIGAVCARTLLDELSIFRIMTRPNCRRKGIAHALLEAVRAYAQQLALPLDLWLEVSVKNEAAIAFYKREGFEIVSVRKDYYPEGDALVMKRPHQKWHLDYELLDFGEAFKLERFGKYVLKRPDAAAIGKPGRSVDAWQFDAACEREGKTFRWTKVLEPWSIRRGPMELELRQSQSKNIGVFPEQEANWDWLARALWTHDRPLRVLNLFAYTGAASIVCAHNLADVCHVDSARSTVRWASENAKRSGGDKLSIRWIVDDAQAFLEKEIRRKKTYDGIILDPPPMGHGQGNRFEFRSDAIELLKACKSVLSKDPAFFLLNAYAMNLKPQELGKLVGPVMGLPFEVGELGLKESGSNRRLSCSVYARWRN